MFWPKAGASARLIAAGPYGDGTYADVIRGLQWVLEDRVQYNIRVLNLCFSTEVRYHYWDDPLNQAVMRLWEAGVVVASADNTGLTETASVNVWVDQE